MNNKEKNILLLLLLCAGLLVSMLYLPDERDDNNIYTGLYVQHQDVIFSAKELNISNKKSPSKKKSAGNFGGSYRSTTASLPTANFATSGGFMNNNTPKQVIIGTITKRSISYAVSTSSEASVSSNGSYAVNLGSVYSNDVKGSSNRYVGGDGTSFSGINTRNTNHNIQTGLMALNTLDLTVFKDLTTKQGGDYHEGYGGSDPGEDPIGNPIPVSDGFWLLLLMAALYGSIKFFKKKISLDYAK